MTTLEARLDVNAGRLDAALLPGASRRHVRASRPSTVLVHAGASRDGEALVRQAAAVANLFGARLIGVSTPPDHAPALTSSLEEDATQLILENAGRCFETWSASVRAGAGWTAADGPPAAALARLAWAGDLIMISNRASGAEGRASRLKSLVVRSGRPVLVCPRRVRSADFKRVLVRWDGSAACHRALSSALPFLARADSVDITPERGATAPSGLRDLRRLQQGLALRGIDVRTAADRDPGRDGTDTETPAAADLIVMSAWPQPRWSPFPDPTDRRLRSVDSFALLSH